MSKNSIFALRTDPVIMSWSFFDALIIRWKLIAARLEEKGQGDEFDFAFVSQEPSATLTIPREL